MGTKHPVTVLSDHKNLNYFRSKQILSDRQTRWMDFLSQFDLQIRYRPGKQSQVPDLLSRRADHVPDDAPIEDKARILLPTTLFAKNDANDNPSHVEQRSEHVNNVEDFDLQREICLAQVHDPLLEKFNLAKEDEPVPVGWHKVDNLWCY
jgi:hypothetical protein